MTKKLLDEKVSRTVRAEALKKAMPDKAEILEDGSEQCDPTRLFVEAPLNQERSLAERVREITLRIHAETAARMASENLTPEQIQRIVAEENNFDIPDDVRSSMTIYEKMGLLSEIEDVVNVQIEEPAPSAPVPPTGETGGSSPA